MNYSNVFQTYLYFENCMTNRASLLVLKKGILSWKDLSCFDVLLV
jgi:hypothetical protein